MMMTGKVLIIDDEPDIRELLSLTLNHMDLASDVAATYAEGIACIDNNNYFLVLTDMRLPDGSGHDIVRYIQQKKPQIPVAVITAYGNIEGAVNTLKAGAFDYVSKPIDLGMLKSLVNTAFSLQKLKPVPRNDLLVGESACIQVLREGINKLSRSQAPVFIQGESGVGKELVARLIHTNGPRAKMPFVPVNCAAITAELMESEFFGHVKGSFTGAVTHKDGLFVAANGGTLFLDEIAELTLPMQVKLLRAIQERAVKPVGAVHEIPIDVRLLSASNKNLHDEIKKGHFREELYYRINVIQLSVPSLRERLTDIPILAQAIIERQAIKQNVKPFELTQDAIKTLEGYSFPGNVRELENILERAMAFSVDGLIRSHDLQLQKLYREPEQVSHALGLDNKLEHHEKEMILNALETTKWNRTAAAKLLGVTYRVLRYRLKKLGID